MKLNPGLAARLAIKNLRHHPMVSAGTVLGVAIGMIVVSAVLIVDNNTVSTGQQREQRAEGSNPARNRGPGPTLSNPGDTPTAENLVIGLIRQGDNALTGAEEEDEAAVSIVPTQEGQVPGAADTAASAPRGEEDYQAMRLAVRLASLLAFSIGTVIVFYTMMFSVAARKRALSLMLCLGEFRSNVSLSLLVEAFILGAMGTLIGLIIGIPIARYLLLLGISTTGRNPTGGFEIPWFELAAMAFICILVALMGIVGPVRNLNRMNIATVLQPRFLAEDVGTSAGAKSLLWAIPPSLVATYILVRPFLESWLSVIQFFLVEAIFVVGITMMTLWWIQPLLRLVLRFFEVTLRPLFPLETKLTGQRMRLTSRSSVTSVIGITLVFSMLISLDDITRALKAEIQVWAGEALTPYVFATQAAADAERVDFENFENRMRTSGMDVFRLSEAVYGSLPFRLIRSEDANPVLRSRGRKALTPETVIFSRTLAQQFDVGIGDTLLLGGESGTNEFEVVDLTDGIGFFPDGRLTYIDVKSYAVFADDTPMFAGSLAETVGQLISVRLPDGATRALWSEVLSQRESTMLQYGQNLFSSRRAGIDRDFLIFDFVIFMTIVLAAVGVANALLIQVHGRSREFSVLTTLGISRFQIVRLLLIEGVMIGLVSGFLALIQGHLLGSIAVAFLDRFTLFEYGFVVSASATFLTFALVVLTCSAAAIYPALVAARPSTAEALHYE